ncbi:signal peptidase I [Candidatus Woesearchaeota archaeon]|nr:signal peptidase I [Candidatus Woesearchaeota archaeon]
MASFLQFIQYYLKKIWKFFWHEDSALSWLLNIIIAFITIKYLVYPLLGLVLGTSYPIVAVVSESMQHNIHNEMICGQQLSEFKESFDNYWLTCGQWYEQRNITKELFQKFKFQDGFNKGDVIILWRAHPRNIQLGDILIFQSNKPQPIIHRVVAISEENNSTIYQTKGDHNSNSITGTYGETSIAPERILGQGLIKIPYLGWVKIIFVELLRPLGIIIEK